MHNLVPRGYFNWYSWWLLSAK